MDKVNLRILRLIDLLVYQKIISTDMEFAASISMSRQTLPNIKAGKQSFTVRHIDNICKKYDVNANWIFGGEKNVFNVENSVEIELVK
jgi:DNA-binding Xre family transcriptional regulator